jgi:hypothetical protein
MSTDKAYEKASRYMDAALQIWESQDKERYCIAENYWNEGMKIYNEYFIQINVLTELQDIDSLLP